MGVDNPLPRSLVALLAVLPWVAAFGRVVARAISTDRALRATLGPGLALAAWLFAVHVAASLTGSFVAGLVSASLGIALAGVVLSRAERIRPPMPATGRAPSHWLWITAALATLAMAPVALDWAFHDELLVTGHMSVASEIQNGVYPPRHLNFPDVPLRYHFGFDLLTAALTALVRVRVDRAIDLGTIGLFAYAWVLLGVLGERFVGRRRQLLVPLLVLFGAGLPLRCPESSHHSGVGFVLTQCTVGGKTVNSPLISYFFQHPWSLGIPIALTAIAIFSERRPSSPGARLAALWLVLTMLSLSEIVLFVTVVPSLVVAAYFENGERKLRPMVELTAVALLSLVAAKLAGGFFTEASGMPHLRFALHAGVADSTRDSLVWNLKTFGVLLPLGLAGCFILRRERALFVLLLFGSLAVVNFVRYEQSWDIAKFATVASIALSVLGSAVIARLLPRTNARPVDGLRSAAAVVLLIPLLAGGVLYPLVYIGELPGIPPGFKVADPLSEDDARAVSFLRRRVRAGELVYRSPKQARAYAQWGGLPEPWCDQAVTRFGFPAARVAARQRLFKSLPSEVAPYWNEGLRYLVVDAEDGDVVDRIGVWMSDGKAREISVFGALRVVELTGPG
jgi:hypothetical protein